MCARTCRQWRKGRAERHRPNAGVNEDDQQTACLLALARDSRTACTTSSNQPPSSVTSSTVSANEGDGWGRRIPDQPGWKLKPGPSIAHMLAMRVLEDQGRREKERGEKGGRWRKGRGRGRGEEGRGRGQRGGGGGEEREREKSNERTRERKHARHACTHRCFRGAVSQGELSGPERCADVCVCMHVCSSIQAPYTYTHTCIHHTHACLYSHVCIRLDAAWGCVCR